MENSTWLEPLFIRTSLVACGFLAIAYLFFHIISKVKPNKYLSLKASFISWLVVAPILFLLAGSPSPIPLAAIILVCIYSAKTFFRMSGMYHRSMFVLTCYSFIFLQGYFIYKGYGTSILHITPMIFLSVICLIPIISDQFEHMIQYTGLSLLSFLFFGWGLIHFGLLLGFDKGIYIALYLIILSEFNDGIYKLVNLEWGKIKPLKQLAPRLSVEALLISSALTLLVAWALRSSLPIRTEVYWASAGIIVSVFGRLGSLLMSMIRKDLGIKDSGNIFIIGKDDILARVDKLIFVAPAIYYLFTFLNSESFSRIFS